MPQKQTRLEAQCHCGKVHIKIAQKPDFINDCNCSLCSNSGGLWGYYPTSDVNVTGETKNYVRADRDAPVVQIHFCQTCGATTHWSLTDSYMKKSGGHGQMGVNMRLFNEDELSGVEVRFPDGKAWTGEGDYTFRKPSINLP